MRDELLEAIKSPSKEKEVVEIPKDERTFTVPKRFLKGKKEGDVVSFKFLLDGDDNVILMPDEPKAVEETEKDLVDEITTLKAMKESAKSGKVKPKTPAELKEEAEKVSEEEEEEPGEGE